jgi:nitrite reductase (NADH) large subunit
MACARECAEAQGKDIGVIVAEDEWKLCVDTPTLIRTVDRFIMFYIRTADRRQRTAAGLESLNGGLDYRCSVIVDDSLGIAVFLSGSGTAKLRWSCRPGWR